MNPAAAQALQRAEHLLALRQPALAAACFSEAERLGADPNHCAGQRWTCFMLLGDYECAWQQNDALRARNAPDPHRVWDGRPLAGQRVLVRSVHGLGDAVQMLRYAPLIRNCAARLTLQVAPSLVELARCTLAVDEVVAWEEETPFDVELEITELAYACRSTLASLPSRVPYLHLPGALLEQAQRRLAHPSAGDMISSPRPRVGLAWTSSAWDPTRSIPFVQIEPLFAAGPAIDFWCLQPTESSPEWNAFRSLRGLPLHRVGDSTIALFAACIAQMDLVITIDSFAAHLAGALGRPAWVLLKKQADWRWLIDRDDSPWYPTLRLFRQQSAGAWGPLMAEAANALAKWAAAWPGRKAQALDATLAR